MAVKTAAARAPNAAQVKFAPETCIFRSIGAFCAQKQLILGSFWVRFCAQKSAKSFVYNKSLGSFPLF
jgi:hypothetical protein